MKWVLRVGRNRRALLVSCTAALLVAGGAVLAYGNHVANATALISPLHPARPVVHVSPNSMTSAPPPTAVQVPVLPSATLPVPQPPYAADAAHPLAGQPDASVVSAAVSAAGQTQSGQFIVNSGWQVRESIQVWSGYFSGSGQPEALEVQGGSAPSLYPLHILGAPGPAYIKGLNGEWVLIQQGFGYEVFDYVTHAAETSDQSGNPGATTSIQYSTSSVR